MTIRRRWLGASIAAALWWSACGPADDVSDPPAPPSVDEVPALTNESPITLTGTAEAGALVTVRGGAASPVDALANDDGSFSIEVELHPDAENTLRVSQTVGELESDAVTLTVRHDGTPPAVPALRPVISPTRRPHQRIRGTTEPHAAIRITGGAEEATGTANDAGEFAIVVPLRTTDAGTVDNELRVVATDAAGNASAPATATITFDPSLPIEAPILDDHPSYTNQSTVTLRGEAEPGVGILAAGGATEATTTVAEDGTFSVDVELRPNQRNLILVFAVSESETSVAAPAIVTHDDIPPEVPHVNPQGSPTGADVVTLTGTSEPGATIAVTGGAAEAGGLADDQGAFSVDVALTADAENVLSVTARDRAGNESEATTLSIRHDSTLEAPIRVDPVASPTRNATVTLAGTAMPDVDVEITGGAETVVTHSDAGDGSWSADVALRPNARNELRVTRPGSGVDTIVVVVHDDTPPAAPALHPIASPTSATLVTVSGTTEPRAQVVVSGGVSEASGTAGTDGRFSIAVNIPLDTATTLSVTATDRAGNVSPAATLTVEHSSSVPDAPIVDETNPAPTNQATYTVTGRVTEPGAGVTIEITGGSAPATGATDPTTGAFSVAVTLAPNAVNTLEVVSVNGAITSPPAIVTVTHDDIAPAAPVAGALTATGSGGLICLRTSGTLNGNVGAVEPRAQVHARNETTRTNYAPVVAMDDGSFTMTARSCAGDQIRVWAVDAAGNVGASVTVTAM